MNCREFVDVVTDYLEGSMSAENREAFEAHLDHCPWCTRYIEQMRVTIRTLGRIEYESIDQDTRERIMVEFRNWRGAA